MHLMVVISAAAVVRTELAAKIPVVMSLANATELYAWKVPQRLKVGWRTRDIVRGGRFYYRIAALSSVSCKYLLV